MYNNSYKANSTGGTAEIGSLPSAEGKIQVQCNNITGTGDVTITVKAGSSDDYTSIVGGTIDLAAPIALLIEGSFRAIKAVGGGGTSFELEVRT